MLGAGALLAVLLLAQQPVFEARVETVRVDVLVTRKGVPVAGLRAEDFVLKDEGVPQRVELVDLDAVPTTAVLALDTSASVAGDALVRLRAAARGFLDRLRPTDEAALVSFDHRIAVRQAPATDRGAVARALERVEAGGASSVIDALYLCLEREWGGGLPLVVLFTDGQDTGSWLENEDVLQAARESATLLHVVGTETPGLRIAKSSRGAGFAPVYSESGFVSLLRRAAEITGGRYWPADVGRLDDAFIEVLDAAAARYVLRYEPRGVPREGRHRIEVTVRRGGLEVHARQEYARPAAR